MFPFFAGVPARAASTPEVLTRAADILSLTAEQAKQRTSIFTTGIVALVNTESDMEVVAEAADGLQAVALFEKHQPDLVLMDSRMTVKTGIEAIIEIRENKFPARARWCSPLLTVTPTFARRSRPGRRGMC